MEKWKLPEGWEWRTVSELLNSIKTGTTPPSQEKKYFNGSIQWFTPGDIGYSKILESSSRTITDVAVKDGKARVFEPETLLVTCIGNIGRVGIVKESSSANQQITGLLFNAEIIDVNFAYYWFRAYQKQIEDAAPVALLRILNQANLKQVPVPIPFPNDPARSLETQKRIILRLETLLGEVKSARELQESIEEETNLLVDSVLTEIFASRDQWQNEKNLASLVSIEASLVDPRDPEYSHFPHIYGASIEGGTGRLLDYQSAAEDGMTSNKYLFEPGVVLYSKIRPYLRKVTIADFKGVCSADMYPLTVTSDELLPEFLMWTLLSPEFTEFINAFSLRARIPKVNREQLMAYRIRYPDINSQKKIAAYIQNWRDEVSEMQRAQRENAELLEQTEQSLLAQAFRGEL